MSRRRPSPPPSSSVDTPTEAPQEMRTTAPARAKRTATRKILLWGGLLLLGGLYEATCGFSALDIMRSVISGCPVLKSRTEFRHLLGESNGDPEELCSHEHGGAICLRPSSIAFIAPRLLGLLVVQLGPVWIWLPLLAWLFVRLRSKHQHRQHHLLHSRALAIHFAPIMVAAIASFLALINIMRFALRLPASWNPGKFDPSGHVFVFGLQLIPLWLLVDVRERLRASTTPAGSVSTELGRLRLESESVVFRACLVIIEVGLWVLSLTTSAFFHTAAEVMAAFLAVAALAFVCERLILSVLLPSSAACNTTTTVTAMTEDEHCCGAAGRALPLSRRILLVGVAVWAVTAACSYLLASSLGKGLGSTIRADLLPSHFAFDAVIIVIGCLIVDRLAELSSSSSSSSPSGSLEMAPVSSASSVVAAASDQSAQ